MIGGDEYRLPKIRESEFGLWFQHKGMHAFQGVPEAEVIHEVMETIDVVCLPLLAHPVSGTDRTDVVRDIRAHANNIQFQLANLFEKSLEVESGKDVLTRLLNRKFLPSVLQREVEYSRRQGKQFAVALIDIDFFKHINDTHGHASGDIVLQQMASLLNNRCRAGDFLFRMGGEEFLMVLVSIQPKAASQFFEQIRAAIEAQPFLLSNEVSLNVTVSIGLALYNGHPDYQYTLRKADEALYRAKHEGRNRLCVATE
jgi:diguanylate cyclase